MHSLKRTISHFQRSPTNFPRHLSTRRPPSRATAAAAAPTTGLDEWNDAWEAAWLPKDDVPTPPSTSISATDRAPWESTATSESVNGDSLLPDEMDEDSKAFVAEMDERWEERKAAKKLQVGALERMKEEEKKGKGKRKGDEYRIKKQRIHAGLWVKEIEKLEESRLGGGTRGDDIDRLLDSCAEIFESGNNESCETKIPSTSELKTKPDGWETTSKVPDGNIWDISQREEDILLQEFERRIAFSKYQIASFIKTHIFSRRRPIDGWKYMIEEIGPNARKSKGSVNRLPSMTDPAIQAYQEEKPSIAPNMSSFRRR
ncbi:ribosomal protein L20 [Rhynchospora pubera]|uniref:Ribosomal protein L20 n=1 Tax=Rhynchospora pubera TaxID=906938 RepID=A0AAV8CC09_9POAL|nr:ribosomal protein L20 [Rhynchospora pubera]